MFCYGHPPPAPAISCALPQIRPGSRALLQCLSCMAPHIARSNRAIFRSRLSRVSAGPDYAHPGGDCCATIRSIRKHRALFFSKQVHSRDFRVSFDQVGRGRYVLHGPHPNSVRRPACEKKSSSSAVASGGPPRTSGERDFDVMCSSGDPTGGKRPAARRPAAATSGRESRRPLLCGLVQTPPRYPLANPLPGSAQRLRRRDGSRQPHQHIDQPPHLVQQEPVPLPLRVPTSVGQLSKVAEFLQAFARLGFTASDVSHFAAKLAAFLRGARGQAGRALRQDQLVGLPRLPGPLCRVPGSSSGPPRERSSRPRQRRSARSPSARWRRGPSSIRSRRSTRS